MRRRPRAIILLLTILVSGTLLFFSILFLSMYHSQKAVTAHTEESLIAEAASNAGIDDALSQLQQNPGWTAGFNRQPLSNGATYSVSFSSSGGIPYSTNNGDNSAAVSGVDGRTVPAGGVHIVSMGYYGTSFHRQEAMIHVSGGLFANGFFGSKKIEFDGNVHTYGYDSSTGSFASTKDTTGGSLATDDIAPDSLVFNGQNNSVGGGVSVGPNGTTSAVDNPSGTTYASFAAESKPVSPAYIAAPPAGKSLGDVTQGGTINPGTYGSIDLGSGGTQATPTPDGDRDHEHADQEHGDHDSDHGQGACSGDNRRKDHDNGDHHDGDQVHRDSRCHDDDDRGQSGGNVVTLNAGTYIFTGDWRLHANTVIKVNGPVKVYISGNINNIGNVSINADGKASDLEVFGQGTTTSVDLEGQGAAVMALYAPNAVVTLKGSGTSPAGDTGPKPGDNDGDHEHADSDHSDHSDNGDKNQDHGDGDHGDGDHSDHNQDHGDKDNSSLGSGLSFLGAVVAKEIHGGNPDSSKPSGQGLQTGDKDHEHSDGDHGDGDHGDHGQGNQSDGDHGDHQADNNGQPGTGGGGSMGGPVTLAYDESLKGSLANTVVISRW